MSLKNKLKDKSTEEIQKILGDAWLNIIVDEKTMFNPLSNIPNDMQDNPHIYITWLMTQPEYFSFLCSEIFKVNILPIQSVILKEMWNRKFPMLIGSRGLGKAIRLDEQIRVKNGWKQIQHLRVGEEVYGSDGKLYNVTAKTDIQRNLKFYKLKLEDNREIEVCEDHMWLVYVGQSNVPMELTTRKLDLLIKSDIRPYFLPISKGLYEETLNSKYNLQDYGKTIKWNKQTIPENVEFSPFKERMNFIYGLFGERFFFKDECSFESDNQILIEGIGRVLRSLGFFTTIQDNKITFLTGEKHKTKCQIKSIERIENQDGMCISVNSPDRTYITKDYIVTHNSFIMGVYAMIRAFLMPGRKIVICGAAFRQSKVIYDYCCNIWNNSPLLRDIMGNGREQGPRNMTDMCMLTLKDSTIKALPIGSGEKIRGQRSNDILADEFASIPRDIFENVIAGFGAVSSDPDKNVKKEARKRLIKQLGLEIEDVEASTYMNKGNQIVVSGTAYYDFNHFADYWKRWKKIIKSKGDKNKLREVFGGGEVPEDFDWKDYSIMRFPVELIPKGFMDDAQVARSKATIHSGIFEMEFGSIFSTDSNGFFKRSLIESCNTGNPAQEVIIKGEVIYFEPVLKGDTRKKYVYGIDPASEIDNFSIIILELHPEHRRVVYCWTTNRKEHIEKVGKRLVKETDFYSYCARKIRDLMKTFPPEILSIDSQGGGIAVIEALHDKDKIDEGELPIWENIEYGKDKHSDGESGLHIIEKIQFASSDWTSEANHGLRKDFEDRVCLFPAFNAATLSSSLEEDNLRASELNTDKLYDTLEDCVMEIEELKNELATIVITQTVSGRDHWDTPEVKTSGHRKGRLRKDRYSALIMANTSARRLQRSPEGFNYETHGGFSIGISSKDAMTGKDFIGSEWICQSLNGLYD